MEGVKPKEITPIHKMVKLCKHRECLKKTYNINSKEEENFILKMTNGKGTSLCTDFLLNVRKDFRKQLIKKKKEYDQNKSRISKTTEKTPKNITKKSTNPKDTSESSDRPSGFTCQYCLRIPDGPSYALNCGHLPFCNQCSQSIVENDSLSKRICPICKQTVDKRQRVFTELMKINKTNTKEIDTDVVVLE